MTDGEVPSWFSSSRLSLQLGKQSPFHLKKRESPKFVFFYRAVFQSGTVLPGQGVLSLLWRSAWPCSPTVSSERSPRWISATGVF